MYMLAFLSKGRNMGHTVSNYSQLEYIFSIKVEVLGNVPNKAKAISAKLLELSLKNKLEETGKTR